MAHIAKKEKNFSTPMMPDWSLLPQELLGTISIHLENCFDVVHARSVCHSWRSSFPFPAYLLRPSYTLPTLAGFSFVGEDFWNLERVPLFLFRLLTPPNGVDVDAGAVLPSEYFLGSIGQEDCKELSSSPLQLQCSVKVKKPGSDATTVMKMLDCQIFPLGHQYRMVGLESELRKDPWESIYRGLAFLPLNEGGGGKEYLVLLNYTTSLLVLRSPEMSWKKVKETFSVYEPRAAYKDVVAFRGRFYANLADVGICVIDPHSLEATLLIPVRFAGSHFDMAPCGSDELFMLETSFRNIRSDRAGYKVSRLDEESGESVVVSDLGNRVLFIGKQGNCSCSAKELPDGCGLSGNSIVFIDKHFHSYICYKYKRFRVNGQRVGGWTLSMGKSGTILDSSPQVLAFRV